MNRINIKQTLPAAYKALLNFENYMDVTSLKAIHKELIRIRASQLNGCSYCINIHTKDARDHGEQEHRIYALTAWRETPFFTEEEQAILALTEEVTLITKGVSDETYNAAIKILGEQKTGEVILAAIIINAWNRVGVTTRMAPEHAAETVA